MTIQEMHVAVNLGVQKIASFQVDNLLPQEIDHELNNAMDRFIKQRYSPFGNKYRKGFEQSQKRIDDLRNLVTTARLKAFEAGETISGFYKDRAALPMDYMFLVNVLADMYYVCPGKLVQGLHYDIQEYNPRYTIANIEYQPGWNLISVNNANDVPYVSGSNLSKEDVIAAFGQNSLNTSIAAMASVNQVAEFHSTDTTLYSTEYFMTLELTPTINSNQILFLSQSAVNIEFVWENQATGETAFQTFTFGNPITFTAKYPLAATKSRDVASYMQHDDLYSNLYDPFNTTGQDRIKYTIEENFIDIHNDETFFTTFVDIKYIRQPKRMNNGSNVGCELPNHTHQEIVEMAIQSILEAISDPRYNSQSREVLESE